jgi:hypothetical protein
MEDCQNRYFFCVWSREAAQVGILSSAEPLDRLGLHDYHVLSGPRKAAHWDTLVHMMRSRICEKLAISKRHLEYPGELSVYPDSRWVSTVHDEPADHEMPFREPMIRGRACSDE